VVVLLLASTVVAQSGFALEEADPDMDQKEPAVSDRQKVVIVKKKARDKDVKGIAVGDFTLYPSISLTEYYDDNIYAEDTNTRDDFVTVVVPAVNIESNWK